MVGEFGCRWQFVCTCVMYVCTGLVSWSLNAHSYSVPEKLLGSLSFVINCTCACYPGPRLYVATWPALAIRPTCLIQLYSYVAHICIRIATAFGLIRAWINAQQSSADSLRVIWWSSYATDRRSWPWSVSVKHFLHPKAENRVNSKKPPHFSRKFEKTTSIRRNCKKPPVLRGFIPNSQCALILVFTRLNTISDWWGPLSGWRGKSELGNIYFGFICKKIVEPTSQ
jgi:hypothetical protein